MPPKTALQFFPPLQSALVVQRVVVGHVAVHEAPPPPAPEAQQT
jgi:hypothetical protein